MNDYNPPKKKCLICLDDKGSITKEYCLQNPKHHKYTFDLDDNLEYFDCWNFIKQNKKETPKKNIDN